MFSIKAQMGEIVYGKGCWCCCFFLTEKGNETLFFFDYICMSKYELNQQSLGTVLFLETVLYIRFLSCISLGWGEWGNPTTYYIVR